MLNFWILKICQWVDKQIATSYVTTSFIAPRQNPKFCSWRCVVYKHSPILSHRVMGDHELNSISPDQIFPDYSSRDSSSDHVKRRHSRICLLAAVVFMLGVCCLVTGVALIVLSQTQKAATKGKVSGNVIDEERPCNTTWSGSKNDTEIGNPCAFSLEAKRAGKPILKVHLGHRISNDMLCIITLKFYVSVNRNLCICYAKPFKLFVLLLVIF